ncbi:MAG: methyltransferase [Magnetococcus sp. YQC-5]
MIRRQMVAAAFGAVASTYEHHAKVQRHAAQQLATKLAGMAIPDHPLVLELGCGSGLLSRYLLQYRPRGRFLLTDASHAMVLAGQRHISDGFADEKLWFAVMDGERPAVAKGFDLIASGLTWQWFEDPVGSFDRLASLLRPGGWLAISTLGEETFREWRSACALAGVPCGAMRYPDRSLWEHNWPLGGHGVLEEEIFLTRHSSALAFLQSLQAIGADRPMAGHRPVTAGALRRLLRSYPQQFIARYHIYYILYCKMV